MMEPAYAPLCDCAPMISGRVRAVRCLERAGMETGPTTVFFDRIARCSYAKWLMKKRETVSKKITVLSGMNSIYITWDALSISKCISPSVEAPAS